MANGKDFYLELRKQVTALMEQERNEKEKTEKDEKKKEKAGG